MVADLDEVLLWGAELAGANGAAEDDNSEDEADDGHPAMTEAPLHPPPPVGYEAPLYHLPTSPLPRIYLLHESESAKRGSPAPGNECCDLI